MAPPGGNWFSQPIVQKTLTQTSGSQKVVESTPMGFDYVGMNENGEGKILQFLGFRE